MRDVVIVGGGPAGLNAALVLGRCRRAVTLFDSGRPRNARSRGVRGFLSRDGIDPWELRDEARRQIAAYPSVALEEREVTGATRTDHGFDVTLGDGSRLRARKLLLATGWADDAPDFPDAGRFYGRGVHPCPYCDGWENRDRPILAFGRDDAGVGLALELLTWSDHVTLLTDGPARLSKRGHARLGRCGIAIVEDRIARLDGDPDGAGLERVVFETGRTIDSSAIFFPFAKGRQSPLVERFGLALHDERLVETGRQEQTSVPGLFVAGDAARSVQFAIVAAGEGATAGYAINTELLREDIAKRERRGLEGGEQPLGGPA